jgi:phenylalanyl-tRNA synthetase alpha chain
MTLRDQLEALRDEAIAGFAAAETPDAIEAVRAAALGRSGKLKDLQQLFGAVPPEEKRQLGPVLNAVKQAIEQALTEAQARLARAVEDEPIDPTLPGPLRSAGFDPPDQPDRCRRRARLHQHGL